MNKLFKKIGNIVLMGLLAVSLTGGMLYSIERKSTAEAAFYPVQTKSVRLYSGISSVSTSARLRSFYDLSGSTKLTMSMFGSVGYVTFDPGTPKEESASFTGITDNGDGTQTLTGLTRGLLGRYPFGTGGVAYSHDANSYVVASNGADFYSKFAFKENNESVTGIWNFNTVLPVSSLIATTSTQFVTKALLDGTIAAGVATSSEANFGGVWLGTALQQASSTNGGTNQPFVMQTRYATDTPTSGCAAGYTGTAGAGCSVIATLTGKIKQTFLDIFSTVNTWTGTNTFTATTTFSATSTFSGNVSSVAFGGRGTDGALVISSGTTTISAGGAEVLVKEYTSISITGTGHLAFSNPDANGTIIYLKSQGDVTLTCSVAPCISTEGMGGAAGNGSAGTEATEQNCGSAGTSINDVFASTAGHGGACGNQTDAVKTGGAGGVILSNLYEYTVTSQRLLTRGVKIVAGSGGAGGTGSRVQSITGSAGGAGGAGGGALYMEVGGYLNLTTTGAISTSGIAGSSGGSITNSVYNLAAGSGGGGGSAGMVVILYNGLTANSGSIVSIGGKGGVGGSCTDQGGSAGGNTANSGNGGGGGGSYGGAGGAGGAGGINGGSGDGVAGSSGSTGSGGGGGGGATCANNLSGSQTGGAGGNGGATLTALVAKNFYF